MGIGMDIERPRAARTQSAWAAQTAGQARPVPLNWALWTTGHPVHLLLDTHYSNP